MKKRRGTQGGQAMLPTFRKDAFPEQFIKKTPPFLPVCDDLNRRILAGSCRKSVPKTFIR
jgi:hypothetical protein